MSIASQLDIKAFFIGILSRIYNAIPEPETQYIIEDKNIHFIWIGSEIPLKYINNILRCSEINKFYDIFIWSDYHFPTILMNTPNIICRNLNTIILKNKELIDQISAHAGKVDVIRLEVIYNYGGIYSDVDAVFIKPFDDNFNRNFVAHTEGYWNICNGCFGFNKQSKFLKFVLDCFPENFIISGKNAWLPELCGPTFFTTCFVQYNDPNIQTIHQNYLINNTDKSYSYHTMDHNWS